MRRVVLIGALLVVVAMAGCGRPGIAMAQEGGEVAFGANPIGSPVTIYDRVGAEIARLSVDEVIDPFTDYADADPPSATERFVLVTLSVENTGERPFEFTPFEVFLLDSLGRSALSTVVTRTDDSTAALGDLVTVTLEPGETVSGAVLYRVPIDAELSQVYYSYYRDVPQLYALANLAPSTAEDDADAEPDPAERRDTSRLIEIANAPSTRDPDSEDAQADDETTTDTNADADADEIVLEPTTENCAWVNGTVDRLNALAPVGLELQAMDDEIDTVRLHEIADELATAADSQRTSNPPGTADTANTQIADALDGYATALEEVAESVESGAVPDTAALLADIQDANALIESASSVTAPLAAACAGS